MPGRANIIRFFQSGELTGDGSEQDVAHGLGYIPRSVIITLTEHLESDSADIAQGTHDATDVKVTAAATTKYRVTAW